MVSSAVSICVGQDSEVQAATDAAASRAAQENCLPEQSARISRIPFLRIPPFPGARLRQFVTTSSAKPAVGSLDLVRVAQKLKEQRVGGRYWGAQPQLPGGCVLVRSLSAIDTARRLAGGRAIVLWGQNRQVADDCAAAASIIDGECDPWHVLGHASTLVTDSNDELLLVGALLGVDCYELDEASGKAEPLGRDARELLAERLCGWSVENPFTDEAMDILETIELCGFWRRLIDSNRGIAQGVGFAFWKQSHVAPLLWSGGDPISFGRSGAANSGRPVAIWRSKVAAETLATLERANTPVIEVEDGFLRSRGLGADCIPPLSITVDRLAAHFDPSRASELELMLEQADFDEPTLKRARELRRLIVDARLSKYDQGDAILERPAGARRHILVPGQVEDDRAVQLGGCGLVSNLDLLKRVRKRAPDAYILYKPHPDVVAGHRRGSVPERLALEFADEIVGELPVSSLIEIVDEVHVNTSLAGFEALLRLKPVTTYGVPFYAGWGLTRDLGPVPSRRAKVRTLDELVAATLLLYPRYLDPVTGLPCPVEIVVARLSVPEEGNPGIVVTMRRIQGKFMRRLRSLVQ